MEDDENMGDKYLQLTYLGADCYNPDDEIIFLNKKCLSYEQIYNLDCLKLNFLDFPSELIKKEEILSIWNGLFHRIWEGMAPLLSHIHNVKHTTEYWEYLSSYDFSPILLLYYERYVSIKKALELCPNIKIKLFEVDEFYLAKNKVWDFSNVDKLVHVIDRQILEALNYPYIENVSLETKSIKQTIIDKENSRKEKNLNYKKLLNNIYIKLSKKASFFNMYNFDKDVNKLRLLFLRKVYFFDNKNNRKIQNFTFQKNIDFEKRKKLFSKFSVLPHNEFEKIFLSNLWKNMSTIWIEDYKDLLKISRIFYKINSQYYIKEFYNEAAMEYAASLIEKGKIVINCGHSIEESFRIFSNKTSELSHYTFQWSTKDFFPKNNSLECVSNMVLSSYSIDYFSNQKILYIFSGEYGRHEYSIMGLLLRKELNEKEFVRKSGDFYLNLSDGIKNYFVFRNRDEHNWQVEKYLCSIDEKICIDNSFHKYGGRTFADSLNQARIIICETIHSTVFFQALLYGIPIIIIEDVNYEGLLNKKVLSLLFKLKEVDIWVSNAEKAAEIINNNYSCIEKWWNEPQRKKIVEEIKNKIWSRLN